jgi:GAF domain-containing protein
MFTNLIARIHNCVREEEILQASVECVKQALKCDRVVVYSVQEQTFGKILAEAVEGGFPRTLETTIDDPCFKSRHVERYRQGAITQIENIHEARMTPCYIENLERLSVKANLVLPLHLPDGELYALLILHQCSTPRAWTEVEITLASQMSAQIGWAIHNALRWAEYQHIQVSLDRYHRYQELLATTPPIIHAGNTRIEVLQIATAQVREVLECDRAIVYVPVEQDAGIIVAESKLPALASIQDTKLALPYFEHRYIEEYQQGRVRAIDNIHDAGFSLEAIENLATIAVKANVIVPIVNHKQELVALLVAQQCFNYRQWQDVEVEWLRQIGIQAGLALTKAQLQEEITAMKSSLKRASRVKDAIANADTKIQQVKQSLADSVQTSGEVKHLMRLLDREVSSLTTKVSDADLNLARIITKKLQANAETANAVTNSLQDKIDELSTVIDSGINVYKSRKSLEGAKN